MDDQWQPISTAPKDGTEVKLRLHGSLRAYWDDELNGWVLSRPFHMESFNNPRHWMPVPEDLGRDKAA